MTDINSIKERAINLAHDWFTSSRKYLSKKDLEEAEKMNNLFKKTEDKSILISIVDIAFRTKNTYHLSKNIAKIFKQEGIPSFFSGFEKIGAILFIHTYPILHFILIPIIKYYLFRQSSNYVLFGNDESLERRIKFNASEKLQTNVNRVGELLLGERDATRRIKQYIKDLENPQITCISIKISTIYSQISSIAFEDTVQKLIDAITPIYRAAKANVFIDKNGKKQHKLVNFDMEEYRDLAITTAVFKKALSLPEFQDLKAGIALQAYLPDSFDILRDLIEFGKERIANGKSPIRVRVVKGANMDMESFESGERNWNFTPFSEKHLTDANYKRMLMLAMEPENIKAVNIGIASHNLFDIAFCYLFAKERGVLDFCTFEMLSGMCHSVAKFLSNDVGLDVLLYLPFSSKKDFVSSIGYLVRRLDENTGIDNYLRYIHDLNSQNWDVLKQKFETSFIFDSLPHKPNRTQNRNNEDYIIQMPFKNEADTDFSLSQNQDWAIKIKEKYENINNFSVPSVIAGEVVFDESASCEIFNHNNKISVGHFYNANKDDARRAIYSSIQNTWQEVDFAKRKEILEQVILNIKKRRGDLIGVMALNTGKIFLEADPEISEAIDFGTFYLQSYEKLIKETSKSLNITAKGTCLVLTPWNFPVAIPAGGIFASLIAGNNVIFKPSNFSIVAGYELAKCFWDAGVPKTALQFITSEDAETAKTLTKSDNINFIIFTGSTNTALNIMGARPRVKIAAETGGKNFTIATKNSDRDAVIKNVLHSAFSNSGQKCSATSVLALESELYRDEVFLENLKDAAKSLKVNFAFDLSTKVGPLIRRPLPNLKYALTILEPGEEWLVKPEALNQEETLWTCGIKIGVKRGSRSHLEEFFGPLLSIMEISNLQEGIDLANETGYGLTSGIETLDIDEINLWIDKIQAGNLYINRSTTGAMVQRQPFGGFNKSAFGYGIKAGGENYIIQLLNFTPKDQKSEITLSQKENDFAGSLIQNQDILSSLLQFNSFKSYIQNFVNYFSLKIDYQNVKGQQNITRFLPANIAIRIAKNASFAQNLNLLFASIITLSKPTIIFEDIETLKDFKSNGIFNELTKNANNIVLSDSDFLNIINKFNKIKFSHNAIISEEIFKKASSLGVMIIDENLTGEGRVDLILFLKEQSISYNFHRYGYIAKHKAINIT